MNIVNPRNNILFIDDEFFCHEIARLTLTKYKMINAYSGEEGIKLAQQYKDNIFLILLDINLPDMSGYEIYNIIKQDKIFNNIPIIFQSGYVLSKEEIRKHINSENEVHIIYKPYTGSALLETIEKFVFAI